MLVLAACGGKSGQAPDAAVPDAAPVPVALVEIDEFRAYSPGLDPLADHQPAMIDCGVAGVFQEGDLLEVDTGYCNYVLVAAPAAVSVASGETIELGMFHFDLTAPEPATAHVAIVFDRDVQWETSIDIPQAANAIHVTFEATRDLEVGEPIRLHLHNHGQNNWALSYVRVLR